MSDEQVEIALDEYCFCGCHAELLETPVTSVKVNLGVAKVNPTDSVCACDLCVANHTQAITESSWKSEWKDE